MATVQEIFDMAIHLIDDQNEDDGTTVHVDTEEYRFRTISILNTAIPMLYPYSGNYDTSGTGRPRSGRLWADSYKNPDFEQEIPLDDDLSRALLPYFLAGQLLMSEDPERAEQYLNCYREAKFDLQKKMPGSFEPIRPTYGLF